MRDVVAIDSGVAVVADNSWAAIQGRKALQIEWDEGANAAWTTASIHDDLVDGAPQMGSAKPGVVEGSYDLPYEAHVPMEPMNCTADVKQDGCDIWAPTQDPQNVQMQVMLATRLAARLRARACAAHRRWFWPPAGGRLCGGGGAAVAGHRRPGAGSCGRATTTSATTSTIR